MWEIYANKKKYFEKIMGYHIEKFERDITNNKLKMTYVFTNNEKQALIRVYDQSSKHTSEKIIKIDVNDCTIIDRSVSSAIEFLKKDILAHRKTLYCVSLIRDGYMYVLADSESEALNIAESQCEGRAAWKSDFIATKAEKSDKDTRYCYVAY